jgi:hypothetical protein
MPPMPTSDPTMTFISSSFEAFLPTLRKVYLQDDQMSRRSPFAHCQFPSLRRHSLHAHPLLAFSYSVLVVVHDSGVILYYIYLLEFSSQIALIRKRLCISTSFLSITPFI